MVLVSRRGLLAGAAVGGGLLVAWALWPRDYGLPLAPAEGESAFNAWLKIGSDGIVTVAVPQLEMGQGVTTLLPQVIAVELGADWRQVAVEPAPPNGAYANVPLAAKWAPLWLPEATPGFVETKSDDLVVRRFAEHTRFMATAEGTSLEAYEQPCREAAAAARAMLNEAAASRWDVPVEECEAQSGFVIHGDKRLRFAELAEEAAELDPPDPAPLRAESAFEEPIAGEADAATSYPRLDLPSKVDGSHLFAGDIRLPGMVYAAIRHGPMDQSELSRFDVGKARSVTGFISAIEGKSWLAAVADNFWAAEKALDAMGARFTTVTPADSAEIEQVLDEALREGAGYRVATRGEGDAAMGKPNLALRYDIAPAQHQPLETATATAWLRDGRLELWIASQAPEHTREAAARAIGLAAEDVVLYPMPAGGSFDRRLEHGHAIEAALIAREVGRPVQLIWSRWQEILAGYPRAPAVALITAKLGPTGTIQVLRSRFATPPWGREFGARLFDNATSWSAIEASGGGPDPMTVEGAMPPYGIPNVAVDHVPVATGLPAGKMRGQAHGYTAFAIESFIDEVAARNNREPLSFRIEMLGQDIRLVECLQRAARLADWGGGDDGSGQGLACHRMGEAESGGRIACIATARRDEGGVRVTKLTAAVDVGRIVNLDLARQQIEGGLVFGLSLSLGSSVGYARGLPMVDRLADLNLPLLADCPEIEVDFIRSNAPAFDPGELGVAVVAPAIANALFSASGVRFRQLPLFSGL
ncbi:xanthine dehydrogenase family protein molybdopterin-binding subunit [Erythrobacter litoralis]|uniref:Aldehyde oxidase and xanthine dehydrogenase, molybdopterin binding n=1 Tax=Erythrobacter litoralis (strain HTCC2594) TaxID=314225 RepID=Q2N7I5_ERYLH|nr:molybdopterin cofactor-binding domain-containing protein [Erythrobacter litoralis]ABC64356.1 Aldehyde oxidase and xanthine dehydrogenase, molybdopterin binding [Erythrobacter litoralis HTCC2594]